MAQKKVVLGMVKGDKGDAGKDAKISSATATITPGHLDEPTCTVDVAGEPGAQTMTFNFAGLQGATGASGEGTTGPAGKDANISAVNVTVNPGHSDAPTATAEVSGDAGNKTISFTFEGLQGKDGVIGKDGTAGKDAGFGTITVTVEDDGEGTPTCDAQWDGENTAKNLTLTFHNLKGAKGDKGQDFKPSGSATDVVLGDGTTKSIEEFITDNIETIREKLGLATTEHMGLVPQLPQSE